MRLRDAEPRDAAAIRSLQSQLSHPSPALSEAAIDGPFTCRVAVEAGRPVGYAVALSGRPTVLSELVVAARTGEFVKQPTSVRVRTAEDLLAANEA